ncbi:MAG: alpha/beta fold hydrolase [Pseudomonadota bacterium]
MQAGNPDQPPVVIVHGALGSRLDDSDGREHWPGSLRRIAFGDYRELRLDIDPATLQPESSELTPSGVAIRAGGVDFYGRILATLETAGGYRRGVLGEPAARGEKRYYVFVYDWRHDNVKNARALHAFLGQVRADYNDPSLQVDVVAHSMGGMIVRYYARYGTVDVLNDNEFPVNQVGEQFIRRVVLLGTPSLGSVGALQTLIRGYRVGFGTIPPEVVATFPSTYQVLPHAITNWFVDVNGRPVKRDHFSSRRFWKAFGYSVYDDDVRADIGKRFNSPGAADAYIALLERYFHKQLERARRFSWSLTVPVPDTGLEYIVFGGDCEPTPARAVLEEDPDGSAALRLMPDEIEQPNPAIDYDKLMFEPGDGTVTKASLLAKQSFDPTVARHRYSHFSIDYPVFLCERHSQLTGNIDFQNNLLHALLSIDR